MLRSLPALVCPLALTAFGLAQESAALFDAPVIQLPDDSPPFQKLFDYDGDGDMDAVGTRNEVNGNECQVSVWRNDNGTFVLAYNEVRTMTGTWGLNMAITTGDFDNDGDEDFVVGSGPSIIDYRNNNHGTSWSSIETPMPQKISDLATGDFDGDGQDDLAILTRNYYATTGELILRMASGTVTTSSTSFVLTCRLQPINVDADPNDEIGVWRPNLPTLDLFDCNASSIQSLSTMTATPADPSQLFYWSSGDIDGDGDADLTAFELPTFTLPARVHTWRQTSNHAFVADAAYLGGPAEFLADADGDGDLDGVCCGGGTSSPAYWPMLDTGSRFEIALNDGTGKLAPSFTIPNRGSPRMAGVADVDLDGDIDLVAGCAVYYSRGVLNRAITPLAGGLERYSSASNTGWRTHLDDFDRDGDLDFLSTIEAQAQNDGSGAFTLQPHDPALLPVGFTAGVPRFRGDFDGDGAPDFVVPLFLNGAFDHMALLRNNGSGHLRYEGVAAPIGQQIGNQPVWYMTMVSSPITADLDGDGDIDIVASADVSYANPYHSEVWWNQGNGHFVPGPTQPTERTECVADFDGDGVLDLFVRTLDGVPSVRLGDGHPNFTYAPAIAVLPALPGFGYAIDVDTFVVVDANDDGRPDILAREEISLPQDDMVLYCNTTTTAGAPTFQSAPITSSVRGSLGNVIFADVNDDGRTDRIVLSPGDRSFAAQIFIRDAGDGSVLQPNHYQQPVEQVIWDGFGGDADGDGDIDLIGQQVVRNLQRPSPTCGLREQYGDATAGEAGIAPLFGATGSIQAGETKILRLSGVTGPTIGVLALSLAPANLPNVPAGATCLVDPTFAALATWALNEPGDGFARGSAEMHVTMPPGIQGIDFYEQVFVLDPAAPQWLAASNGLHIRVGG